ncbi:MAG: hypothetical protein J4F28_08780 [Nitrosopumilaceae archaeon]|nr:hypothetical protein [Nitrosopumilaceae archaeon]
MGEGPVTQFKRREPFDVLSNPKVKNTDSDEDEDEPTGNDKGLPAWAKSLIVVNTIAVHAVVVSVGIEAVPFKLSDAALAAYVVTCLGVPVGLASQAIRGALAGLFGLKSST